MANFQAAESTLNFLKKEEGFQAKAYWDQKQYSIGYGSGVMPDGRPVKQGDTITQAEALTLLKNLIDKTYGATVNRVITAPINRNQWDALTSFCYNVGTGAFSSSTLVKVVNLNPNDFARISTEFDKWIYSNGVVIPALVSRRKREAALYKNQASDSFFLS